jgi:hypothetical protein
VQHSSGHRLLFLLRHRISSTGTKFFSINHLAVKNCQICLLIDITNAVQKIAQNARQYFF